MNARSNRYFRRNRLRLAAIGVLAPGLGLAVAVLPSSTPAALAFSCPTNQLCTWQNAGYQSTQWNFHISAGQPSGNWWYVGNAANDRISSIVNRTAVRAWVDKDCVAGGNYTWLGSGAEAINLSSNKWPDGSSMNDSISAWAIGGSTVPHHGSRTAGGC
jgi:hypothetical protein